MHFKVAFSSHMQNECDIDQECDQSVNQMGFRQDMRTLRLKNCMNTWFVWDDIRLSRNSLYGRLFLCSRRCLWRDEAVATRQKDQQYASIIHSKTMFLWSGKLKQHVSDQINQGASKYGIKWAFFPHGKSWKYPLLQFMTLQNEHIRSPLMRCFILKPAFLPALVFFRVQIFSTGSI